VEKRGISKTILLCSDGEVQRKVSLAVSGSDLSMMGLLMVTLQQATKVNTGMLNFGDQCCW
jgi:ABC-type enterochelin transport system permease subunit